MNFYRWIIWTVILILYKKYWNKSENHFIEDL